MLPIKHTLLLVFELASIVVFAMGIFLYFTIDNQIIGSVILTSSIIISAILMITAYYISRMISKPIMQLKYLMSEFSKNDKLQNVKDFNSNIQELTDLYKDFISMTKTVEKNITLEKTLVNELKSVDKQKNEFVSMMSHELKTPLVLIKGYAELLLKANRLGALNPQQFEAVSQIYEGSLRLEKLIEDILTVEKLELRKMSFTMEPIEADAFIKNRIKDFAMIKKEKQIEFVNGCKTSSTIVGDKDRLYEVFVNLVENAEGFLPKENGQIEIGAFEKSDEVIFYVKDNGKGIPLAKQQNLFTKFYQIDTSPRRSHQGNGLGLCICKGIIESLNGQIWVESQEGKGCTFFFKLPKESKKILSSTPQYN